MGLIKFVLIGFIGLCMVCWDICIFFNVYYYIVYVDCCNVYSFCFNKKSGFDWNCFYRCVWLDLLGDVVCCFQDWKFCFGWDIDYILVVFIQ